VIVDSPTLASEPFGRTPDGAPVDRWTLDAGGALTVAILTYGAIVQEIVAPDREGEPADVVLGFSTLEDYLERNVPCFGAIVGRYANRIANAAFTLDGIRHELAANDGRHCLHGGGRGFGTRVWHRIAAHCLPDGVSLALRHASADDEEGFPGALVAEVTYTLRRDDSLRIDLRAATDRPTVVNLSSHVYWQLAGEGAGSIEDHILRVAASRYLPVDADMIPTGELAPVDGTPFDFRAPTRIGARLRDPHEQLAAAHGYDHHLVLDGADRTSLVWAVSLEDPASGRRLELETTEPGIQVYSANHLDGSLAGASGRLYRQGDGIALETQHCPDSPNRPELPSTVLRPGEVYASATVYRLSAPEEEQ